MGALEAVNVEDGFLAANVVRLERLTCREGGITRRLRRTIGARELTYTGTRCERSTTDCRSLTSALAGFVLYRTFALRRFLRRTLIIFNDDLGRYDVGFRYLIRFLLEGVLSSEDATF